MSSRERGEACLSGLAAFRCRSDIFASLSPISAVHGTVLTALFDVHPLSPKHLGKIERRVDIKIHLFPVIEHFADIIMIFGFKHVM
jgi:hypothetical protein